MKPVKVLIVESSIDLARKLESSYQEIFNLAGYNATFALTTSEGEARKEIDKNWPHVVICDMSLGQVADGLLILKTLRTEYPDIFRILASGSEYSPRNVFAKKAFFDMFFDKGELIGKNKPYIEICAQQFASRFRINTILKIEESGTAYHDDFKSKGQLREFNSLLAQITFTGHDSDTQITPDTVRISKLAGGFSGSKVYKFNTFNSKSKLESVPAVLKVSEREWAASELNNYNKFVKWGLPYKWRVDLLGSGETKSLGAVAYSFIQGDSGVDFNSLTYFLETGSFDVVRKVIERIFSPNMRRWYGEELIESSTNIVEHYSKRYFSGAEAKATSALVFNRVASDTFRAIVQGKRLAVAGIVVVEPHARLFGTPMDRYLSCICHGDLNSNNVIVSKLEDVIFIDFQETGRGHVFEDFVTMESSIRLFGKSTEPSNWLHYLEDEIQAGQSVAHAKSESFEIIQTIRGLAKANFPNESFQNYYYALAVFHYRLLRANLSPIQQQKCVTAIIAGLTKL